MKKKKVEINRNMGIKELWIAACKYDDIDPTAKFVVWSNNNPYAEEYNKKMLEEFEGC